MSPHLRAVAVLIGLFIFLGIIELVRRRRLREEYSFIWLITGFVFVVLAVEADTLAFFSFMMGVAAPISTLLFLALIFVLLLCLYFSLRISALTTQVKNLAQQLALLQSGKDEVR